MTTPAIIVTANAPANAPVVSSRARALADARDFISELERLRETDRGRMAQLRRNAGETLPGNGTAWIYAYLYTAHRKRYAEIHFLVATLFDWNRRPSRPGNFGQTVRQLLASSAEEAVNRRFRILLDAKFDVIRDPFNEIAPW